MNMITLSSLFMTIAGNTGLPSGLLDSLCYVESRHKAHAINYLDGSSASFGICQIKLETARILGFKGNTKQLMNPKVNITYAAKYLKKQLDRYDGNIIKAVAAYNSGTYREKSPGLAKNHLYIKKVMVAWQKRT